MVSNGLEPLSSSPGNVGGSIIRNSSGKAMSWRAQIAILVPTLSGSDTAKIRSRPQNKINLVLQRNVTPHGGLRLAAPIWWVHLWGRYLILLTYQAILICSDSQPFRF